MELRVLSSMKMEDAGGRNVEKIYKNSEKKLVLRKGDWSGGRRW